MVAFELIRGLRQKVLEIAERHGARNVRVFGSALRDTAGPIGDLDFLVEFLPGRSLLDHVALWQDLEECLGVSVDVVAEGGISPYLADRILAEARPL